MFEKSQRHSTLSPFVAPGVRWLCRTLHNPPAALLQARLHRHSPCRGEDCFEVPPKLTGTGRQPAVETKPDAQFCAGRHDAITVLRREGAGPASGDTTQSHTVAVLSRLALVEEGAKLSLLFGGEGTDCSYHLGQLSLLVGLDRGDEPLGSAVFYRARVRVVLGGGGKAGMAEARRDLMRGRPGHQRERAVEAAQAVRAVFADAGALTVLLESLI